MIDPDVILGENVRIFDPALVNIFGCRIGDGSFVGPFVEITRNVEIGRNCIIESHSFICDSVILEEGVFVGHGVMFTNDLYPRTDRRVEYLKTRVEKNASIGSNATIVGGVTIGENAVIGAGALVTRDIPRLTIAAGVPARVQREFADVDSLIEYIRERQPTRNTR